MVRSNQQQSGTAATADMGGRRSRYGRQQPQAWAESGSSRGQQKTGRQAGRQGGAVAGQEQEQSKQVRAQPHHDHDDHHQQLQQSGAAQQQQHTVIDRNQQLAAAPKQYHLATTTSRSSSSAPARRPPEENGKPVETLTPAARGAPRYLPYVCRTSSTTRSRSIRERLLKSSLPRRCWKKKLFWGNAVGMPWSTTVWMPVCAVSPKP